MTCRLTATLDLPTPRPFVHHNIDFSRPLSPLGFEMCTRCGDYVTAEQWAAWECKGRRPDTFAPVSPGEVACALCAGPVYVSPEHRAQVRFFGTLCNACVSTSTEAVHD